MNQENQETQRTLETSGLFARDGHLTMLSLDRYDAGELDASARRGLESHVECCSRCRARMQDVASHEPVLAPPITSGRSTGSATIAVLATSTGVALAASAVLGLGSALWPSPRAARESAVEPSHSASSYTSVAQEYSEPADVDVDVETRAGVLVATPQGDPWLAVVVVHGDVAEEGAATISAVLRAARTATEPVAIPMTRRPTGEQVVVVACPGPFAVEPGDALVLDPGCVTRERP